MTRHIRVPFLRVGQRLPLSDGSQFSETPPHDADQDRRQLDLAARTHIRQQADLGHTVTYRDAVLATSGVSTGRPPAAKPDLDRGQLAAAARLYQSQQAQLGRTVSARDALLEVSREESHQ
jgi:hypothetical protein